jgi:FAD/FMN-containing dehydrogenase/Fe-S oxidoreductase
MPRIIFPSPGTPGEGQGGGFFGSEEQIRPHPNPPPEYQGRGKASPKVSAVTPLPVIQQSAADLQRIAADLSTLSVGEIRFDRHNRRLYATDASLYEVEPLGVVLPNAADQVERLLRYCNEHRIAMLPRGGGTSLAGQCTNRAIVLDLSAFCRRLISADIENQTCEVEPGITVDELNRTLAARKTDLFFAADPATSAQASIGGCIGNNAAGARSIRYGRTSENLAGVDVMLPNGDRCRLASAAGRSDAVALRLAQEVANIVHADADQIRARFPRLVRRNAGYGLDLILAQLDRGIPADDLDLSGLICGSEGTLAVVVGATLRLRPVPAARGLAIASFSSLDAAIDAVQPILQTFPSAIELLDKAVLAAARGNEECRHYVDLLPRVDGHDPVAALYVEYESLNQPNDLGAAFESLRGVLPGIPLNVYQGAGPMAQAWTLRKSSEALLHALSSTRKPITFVEDNSVPVENLARFVSGFRRIVESHGTDAAYYAHASVGVLHVRPMLDPHNSQDLERMRSIAVEVADLARECGGVMSGEHGDGRVRGPLLERFYGPQLMAAFAAVKRIFDPNGILNPGMTVGAGPIESITQNLRTQAAGSVDPDAVRTFFDYADQEGFRGAIEMCNGAGFCRKTAGGTMCPSYRATFDERHSTRGRANALRDLMTHASGPSPNWNDPDVIATLDLCLSCKACKTECPSNVDMSRLKAEFTAQRYRAGKTPFSAKIFGNIRTFNRFGSLIPGVANALARSTPIRRMMNRLLGLAPQRSLPDFQPPLDRWLALRGGGHTDRPRIALFADCFTTYNDTHVGRAAVSVLETLGYSVDLPRVGCCGRAMISTGLLEDARRTIGKTIEALRPSIEDEHIRAIVVCEPSCLSAIKDDWLQLKLDAPITLRRKLAAKAMLVEEFVERFWNQHPTSPAPNNDEISHLSSVILHGHCHQKALWGDRTSSDVFKRLLGDRVHTLDSGCCGMAGSFGYTANHYDLSMKIGELAVFPPIRAAASEAVILAPGTSCRHQIRDETSREAIHPVELLARLLCRDM